MLSMMRSHTVHTVT
ncbi:hypothetical protein L3Q82_019377 [Scortum barcoo]|uniref:Uncharacterized protein n=1 Tax=Scortum barcoo TaxID=214431 RepID=A0ACB8VBA6_9TELE|nr:hypothetical protein L3Q82_019377 [Scortum barcoo]